MRRKKGWSLKDTELKLIAELMKNSRRSDRQLSKAIGVSQPTISRTIKKLEDEGYIEKYTLLPNFSKLGFKLLAVTFAKFRSTITSEERQKARERAKTILKNAPCEVVMIERGMGLGYGGVFLSYHETYSDYTKFLEWFNQFETLQTDMIGSFIINLEDDVRYRPLDFSLIADYLLKREKKKYRAGSENTTES